MQASRTLAEQHYAVHKGKPFYESLLQFLTSGPTVALVLEGREAVAVARTLIGADRRRQGGAGHDPRRFRHQRAEQPDPRQRQPGQRRGRNRPVVQAGRTGRLPARRFTVDRRRIKHLTTDNTDNTDKELAACIFVRVIRVIRGCRGVFEEPCRDYC